MKRRASRAQALTEFALVLPIILFMIFGIIDFGWMIFNYAQLHNSLREGLRYGSVSGFNGTAQYLDCNGIRQRITSQAGFSGLKATNIIILYDDGRPTTNPTDTADPHAVGYCPAGGTFTRNTHYDHTARDVQLGDRIIIDIRVNVRFLTPFIRPLVPGGGITMNYHAARSVFPGGLG